MFYKSDALLYTRLSVQSCKCCLVHVYQDVVTTDSDDFVEVAERQLAVARVGGFRLNLKASLRCVLAGVLSGWLWASGTLVNEVLNAVHKHQSERVQQQCVQVQIMYGRFLCPKYEQIHERSFIECVRTQH